MDPLVIDVQPIGLRVDFHELRLNLFRRIVVARRKPQLMGDAEYMRIDSDALRVAERLARIARTKTASGKSCGLPMALLDLSSF